GAMDRIPLVLELRGLLDDDMVFRLEQDVLVRVLALNYIFVIKLEPLGAALNNDVLLIGKIFESTGVHQRLKHGGRDHERVLTRPIALSNDVTLLGGDRSPRGGYLGFAQDILPLEAPGDSPPQLPRGLTRSTDPARQRHGNPAVRPHYIFPAQRRFPPDQNE